MQKFFRKRALGLVAVIGWLPAQPLQAQMMESFEDVPIGQMPPVGWKKWQEAGGRGWSNSWHGRQPMPGWMSGTNEVAPDPDGGSRMAYVTYTHGGSKTNDLWLISPKLHGVVATSTVSFWYRSCFSNFADNIYLHISTNDNAYRKSDFTIEAYHRVFPRGYPVPDPEIPRNDFMPWTNIVVNIGSMVPPGTDIYLGFREYHQNNWYDVRANEMDVIRTDLWSAPWATTVAARVLSPSVVAVDYNIFTGYPEGRAGICWGRDPEPLVNMYNFKNVDRGSGTCVFSNVSVASKTWFRSYVQHAKGTWYGESKVVYPGDSEGESFLFESFEDTPQGLMPPAGWSKWQEAGGRGWSNTWHGRQPMPGWMSGTNTVPDVEGAGSRLAYVTYTHGGSKTNDLWLISPTIENASTNLALSFWYNNAFSNFADSFSVWVSEEPKASRKSDFDKRIHYEYFPRGYVPGAPPTPNDRGRDFGPWTNIVVDVGSYITPGSDIRLGFQEYHNNNWYDVRVTQLDVISMGQRTRGGLYFDGVDDQVVLSVSNNTEAYTLEAWVRPDSIGAMSIVVGTDNDPMVNFTRQLRMTAAGRFEHYTWNGAEMRVTGTTVAQIGTWYHVAGVARNGNVMRLYVNGVEEGSAVPVGTAQPCEFIHIGSASGHSMGTFHGAIDEVRLWDTVRTPVQLLDTMNIYARGVEDHLKACYRLDRSEGGDVFDSSANKNDSWFCANVDSYVWGHRAPYYNGVDDSDVIPATATPAYTIQAWVQPRKRAAQNVMVFSSGDPVTSYNRQLRINSLGQFEHYAYDGAVRMVTGTTIVETGAWYHVVGTAANGGTMRLYVNGIEEGNTAAGNTLYAANTGTAYHVAAQACWSPRYTWFKGRIRDVGVTNVQVSPAAIQAVYAAGLASSNKPSWVAADTPQGDYVLAENVSCRGLWSQKSAFASVDGLALSATLSGATNFIVTGHNQGSGSSATDTPTGEVGARLNRIWHLDTHGATTAVVDVDFTLADCSAPGFGMASGRYALWFRPGQSGAFSVLKNEPDAYSGGVVSFDAVSMSEGYYTLALKPPDAPEMLASTAISSTSYRANWSAVPDATNYQVDVSASTGFSPRVSGFNARSAGNQTYLVVTGLLPGVTYYTRTRAQHVGGLSTNSASIATTTLTEGSISFTSTTAHASAIYSGSDVEQSITYSNSGQTVFAYTSTVAYGGGASGWLSLNPTGATILPQSNSIVTASVSIAGLNAGTYLATTTVSSVTATNSPQSYVFELTVDRASQSITFADPGTQHSTNRLNLSASTGSGLPATYSVLDGPGQLLGGTQLYFTAAGTVSIVASQAGNSNFYPAASVTQTFAVVRSAQAPLIFTPASPQTVFTTNLLTASGGSGGGGLSYHVVSGPGSISNSTYLYISSGTGTVYVSATRAQDDMYLARSITSAVTAAKATQSIDFAELSDAVWTSTVSLSATASSKLSPAFEIVQGPAVLDALTNVIMSGYGTVGVRAVQAGNSDWAIAPSVTNYFESLGPEFGLLKANGQAMTNGGMADVGAILYGGTLTNTFTLTNNGTANLEMFQITTNGSQASAFRLDAVPDVIEVNSSAVFTVTFSPIQGETNSASFAFLFNGTNSPWVVNVFGYGQGGAIAFSTNLLRFSTTYQGTDPSAQSLTVTNNGISSFTYTNLTRYGVTASGWLDTEPNTGVVQRAGSTWFTHSASVAGLNAGVYWATNITAAYDATNSPQAYVISFEVDKASQGLSFDSPGDQITTNLVSLTASADSGLEILFAVEGGPGQIDGGSNLSFTGSGNVVISAAQPGNSNWYAAVTATRTIAVTKAFAQLAVTNLSATYDGEEHAVTPITTPAELTVVLTYEGQTMAPHLVGSYVVTGVVDDVMYQAVTTNTLVINTKGLTVTGAVAQSKTYDGNTAADLTGGSLVGIVSGDTVDLSNAATGTFAQATIGTNITVSSFMGLSGEDAGNYSIAQPALAADITAKGLTVTGAVAQSKIYDRSTAADLVGGALVGIVSGDAVDLSNASTGTFAQATIGTNITVSSFMGLSGEDAGNYSIAQPALAADITAKGLTVTGAVAQSKTYDGNTGAELTGGSLVGIVSGDTVDVSNASTGTFAQATIGTNITVSSFMGLSGENAGNYSISQPTLAADITAKGLVVTGAVAQSKIYDGDTGADIAGGTLVGIVSGDTVDLSNAATGTFAQATIGTNITVSSFMGLSGEDAGNYSIAQPALAADITAKGLTVTGAVAQSKIYDRNTAADLVGGALVGIVSGDAVDLSNASTGTFAQATIGTNITVSSFMGLSGEDAGNYSIAQPALAADITAKGLTVTGAVAQSKTYDAGIAADLTGGALVGIVSGDTVDLSNAATGTFAQATIGTNITVSSYMGLSGADADNYSISQPALAADITAKGLTVTGAVAQSKTYDGNTAADLTGGSLVGIVSGDTVALSNAATGTFAQANMGTNITVSTFMGLSGEDAGNYSIAQPALAADITAKGLTVTGIVAQSKIYDRSTAADLVGGALVGIVSGDAVDLSNASTGTFAQATIGTNITVSSFMGLSGEDAGNYSIAQPALAADITAKGLTVTGAVAQSKIYDGNTGADLTGGALVGIVSGDTVDLSNAATGTFAQATIGTNITVSSYMGLSGADAGNYSVSQPALAADITAKGLTVTGAVAQDKIYDGTAGADITGGALVGVVGLDDVELMNTATGTFAMVNVASNIEVSSFMELDGSDAFNYSIAQPPLVADILKSAQKLVFPEIRNQSITSLLVLAATGGETGHEVIFSIASGPALLSSGTNVTFSNVGAVSVCADQAGNSNYLAARLTNTFTVYSVPPEISGPWHSNVLAHGAAVGAFIVSSNGAPVTTRGVVHTALTTNEFWQREYGSWGAGPFSLTATGLTAGVTNTYRLFAINNAGTNFTHAVRFLTIPDAPQVLASDAVHNHGFTTHWVASTGATNYFLDVSPTNDFSELAPGYSNRYVGPVTAHSVTGLISRPWYHVRIRAQNAAGISTNSATLDTGMLLPVVIAGWPMAHGAPALPYGTNLVLVGTVLTNSVGTPADELAGTHYVCTGFVGTGNAPFSGGTNIVVFTLSEASTLTWQWQTEHYLDLSATNGIITNSVSGWMPEGWRYGLYPVAAVNYLFHNWITNDVTAGTANPLMITMDSPLKVSAVFEEQRSTVRADLQGWTLDPQYGWYTADLHLCNHTNSTLPLVAPYRYLVPDNGRRGLLFPDGVDASTGHPFAEISDEVQAQLLVVGNADHRLDPGECVTIENMIFYSIDRSIPTGTLVAAISVKQPQPDEVTDTDGDRLPDAYERQQNCLNEHNPLDAGQDSDGDGMSAIEEYAADTQPDDPGSLLLILNQDRDYITYVGGVMATQYLEASPDLQTWCVLGTNIPPTAVSNAWPVTHPAHGQFYRISVPLK